MPSLLRSALAAALLVTLPPPAGAQQALKLEIREGRVTLHAENVPVRQILAEWARVGSTTIVNGERVSTPPVTLDLRDVPERQALDIVLRGVPGYVLGARSATAPGSSSIDRVLILAASAAPRAVPSAAPSGFPVRQPLPVPQINQDDPEENPAVDVQAPAGRVTRPGVPRRTPVPIPQPLGADEPAVSEPDAENPSFDGPEPIEAPSETNPFGVPAGSATTPGVITAPPQPRTPPRPRIQDPD